MNKILAFQKDKNKLTLLLIHAVGKKIILDDYKEYEIGTEDKEKTPACQGLAGGVEFIKQFVSDNKAVSSQAFCFLPLASIYVRKLTFPYRRISKISKSIRFAVEPHIPIPVENTEVFFHPIHAQNNNLEVMTFIIPKDILNEQLELISSTQLACNEIYLTPLSLFDFFISNVQIKENILWLYVGQTSTYILYVLKNGKLADLKEIPIGRKNLTQEKGELKREISTILLSMGSESAENDISEIHLSGLPEICDWLAESFNIPVKSVEFNNLLSVEQSALLENGETGGAESERGFNFIPEILYASYGRTGPLSINFYPPVLQKKEKRGILISCFLVIFALLILSFRLQFERSIYERKFSLLDSRLKEILLETFPETTDTRTPLLQMKSRVNSLKSSTIQSKSEYLSPLEALKEISQNIDKNLQIKLDSFRLKEENIIISGSASSSADIDKIKEFFGNSPLFSGVAVEIQRTDKGVIFRLTVSTARSDVTSGTKINEK